MTRIVAGRAGGRRLAVPTQGTRPTSERVREALFNALDASGDLTDARVLDLYAGSGALGLEAISRGAAEVLFVESDRRAVQILQANIRNVGLGGTVRAGVVDSVLKSSPPRPYTVVLMDPPYAVTTGELASVLSALGTAGWIDAFGLVVVERATRDGEPDWPSSFAPIKTKRYGDTSLYWAEYRPHA